MRQFWQRLARFAVRRLNEPRLLAGRAQIPVGMPGNRDPENPCPVYTPTWMYDSTDLVAVGPGACVGDGHYLCEQCEWHCPGFERRF